jgi:hypothetical protein
VRVRASTQIPSRTRNSAAARNFVAPTNQFGAIHASAQSGQEEISGDWGPDDWYLSKSCVVHMGSNVYLGRICRRFERSKNSAAGPFLALRSGTEIEEDAAWTHLVKESRRGGS